MGDFKDAIFIYETADLPEDLKVVDGIAKEFELLPEAKLTLVQVAHSLEQAAPLIDSFKAQCCGSPYSLAIINLNGFQMAELNFILRPDVLGDPQTIFLTSLKYMVGDAYALARDKSLRESERKDRTPSCIDCYGTVNLSSVCSRVSQLAAAYLHESEMRVSERRSGKTGALESKFAANALKKSQTTFVGRSMRSGLMPSVSSTHSGRFPKDGSPPAKGHS